MIIAFVRTQGTENGASHTTAACNGRRGNRTRSGCHIQNSSRSLRRGVGPTPKNAEGRLRDRLDEFNSYIVVKSANLIAGFISITPPGGASYSVDKYFPREEVPLPFDDGLYELRLLTVAGAFRGSSVAAILMLAALRWIESLGGTNIVAIGRVELLDLYVKAGLRPTGKRVKSGAVTFELLTGTVGAARKAHEHYWNNIAFKRGIERRLENLDWQLEVPRTEPRPPITEGPSSMRLAANSTTCRESTK